MQQLEISAAPLWMENAAIPPPIRRRIARPRRRAHRRRGLHGPVRRPRDRGGGAFHAGARCGRASAPGAPAATAARSPTASSPRSHSLRESTARTCAFGICREGLDAVAYLRSLATQEIDCGWREDGCFFGAHTPRHFERMAREAENQPRGLEQRISVVSPSGTAPRNRQRLLSRRLRLPGRRVRRSYAAAARRCCAARWTAAHRWWNAARSSAIAAGPRWIRSADAARQSCRRAQVLLATNGYSGPLSPWHRRRVIPIGSYQIATEPLGAERVRDLDSPRTKYRRFAARGRVFQAFGGRRAHRIRRPRGARREGSARLRAAPAADDGADIAAIAIGAGDSRLGGVGRVHFRYPAAPRPARGHPLLHGILRSGRAARAVFRQSESGSRCWDLPEGRTALDGLPFPVAALLSRKALVSRAVGICLPHVRCTRALT